MSRVQTKKVQVLNFFGRNQKNTMFAVLIVSLFILAFSFFKFMIMWHNVDLAYNMMKDVSIEQNMYDEYAPGEFMFMKHIYINSMMFMLKLQAILVLASVTFGICLQWVFSEAK